ncbi:hypothetical protein H6P81_010412 [Aristolochia fimbriata]|uniref:Uncharacterized protein n=1 Tax=Aristolochia fimbriata TaxID=158543 RepID=A0AAV7ES32_ARIFI|nr:hypothetical protein H6P81_010412 [Aristolochia fimbriata]
MKGVLVLRRRDCPSRKLSITRPSDSPGPRTWALINVLGVVKCFQGEVIMSQGVDKLGVECGILRQPWESPMMAFLFNEHGFQPLHSFLLEDEIITIIDEDGVESSVFDVSNHEAEAVLTMLDQSEADVYLFSQRKAGVQGILSSLNSSIRREKVW